MARIQNQGIPMKSLFPLLLFLGMALHAQGIKNPDGKTGSVMFQPYLNIHQYKIHDPTPENIETDNQFSYHTVVGFQFDLWVPLTDFFTIMINFRQQPYRFDFNTETPNIINDPELNLPVLGYNERTIGLGFRLHLQ